MPDKTLSGEASEKKLEAWELFKAGHNYRDIAKMIGRSKSQVGDYIKDTLEELKEARMKIAKNYVEVELERLDKMLSHWVPLVGEDPIASEMVLKIMQRRTKYLGMDAPVKQEVSGVISLAETIQKANDEAEKNIQEQESEEPNQE